MEIAKEPSLKKLEYLSLVSKVCTELESHLRIGDKVLAEFLTDIGRKCETVDEFDSKLKENRAEMPDYFTHPPSEVTPRFTAYSTTATMHTPPSAAAFTISYLSHLIHVSGRRTQE
ncbi:hypothetical protein L1887_41861 [Cichorium endivia]|nr:hypothetical protein L1887_41861 [Cichorium endivia]